MTSEARHFCSLHSFVRRSIPLLLNALWDAKLWQDSIEDAHTLNTWDQTADLTRTANRARKLSKRYVQLHDALLAANAELSSGIPYAPNPCSQGGSE